MIYILWQLNIILNIYCWYAINKKDGFNTLRPRQNGRHFADAIFKGIFLNENVWIPIKLSLKFVPKGPINNIPALVQIMAWRRPGDKPLSGPMMVSLLAHICVTRPQWVNCQPDITVRFHYNVVSATMILHNAHGALRTFMWRACAFTMQISNGSTQILEGPLDTGANFQHCPHSQAMVCLLWLLWGQLTML